MSKTSLMTLKSEITRNLRTATSVQTDLSTVDKDLFSAMNDYVGNSARESVESIKRNYTYMMNNGYGKMNEAVSALEYGYNQIDTFMNEASKIVSDAKSITRELGDLKL
jgi:hypothetical protein